MKKMKSIFLVFVLVFSMAMPAFAASINPANDGNVLRTVPDKETKKDFNYQIGGAKLTIHYWGYYNDYDGYSEISGHRPLSNPSNVEIEFTDTSGAVLVDLYYNGQHVAYIVSLKPNGKWTNVRY